MDLLLTTWRTSLVIVVTFFNTVRFSQRCCQVRKSCCFNLSHAGIFLHRKHKFIMRWRSRVPKETPAGETFLIIFRNKLSGRNIFVLTLGDQKRWPQQCSTFCITKCSIFVVPDTEKVVHFFRKLPPVSSKWPVFEHFLSVFSWNLSCFVEGDPSGNMIFPKIPHTGVNAYSADSAL